MTTRVAAVAPPKSHNQGRWEGGQGGRPKLPRAPRQRRGPVIPQNELFYRHLGRKQKLIIQILIFLNCATTFRLQGAPWASFPGPQSGSQRACPQLDTPHASKESHNSIHNLPGSRVHAHVCDEGLRTVVDPSQSSVVLRDLTPDVDYQVCVQSWSSVAQSNFTLPIARRVLRDGDYSDRGHFYRVHMACSVRNIRSKSVCKFAEVFKKVNFIGLFYP